MNSHRFEPQNAARIARYAMVAAAFWSAPAYGTPTGANESTDQNETGQIEDADATVRSAREAFVRGTLLAHQGRWSDALDAFEKSYALRQHPVTSYNLGYCERAVGHYTRAHKMLHRALREHASGEVGELPERLVQLAHHYLDEADNRIARVEATVSPTNARLLVDGRPLEREPDTTAGLGASSGLTMLAGTREPGPAEALPAPSFTLLLDPGTHIIVVSRPGAPDRLTTARVEAGEVTSLTLAFQAVNSQVPRHDLPNPPTQSSVGRRWGYVSLGVGVTGLAVGGIFAGLATHQQAVIEGQCGGTSCADSSMQSEIDTWRRYGAISTISFVAGVVGVGIGVATLLLVRDAPTRPGATQITPVVGWGSIGIAGRL